jgi:uncharacterized protein YtpQ (UPF0354 family)
VSENRLEIHELRQTLLRPDLARDALFLLVSRLIELQMPDKRLAIRQDEAIDVTGPGEKIHTVFLGNLLAECLRSPDERIEIVDRYLKTLVSNEKDPPASRSDIVSMVRHSDYRSYMNQDEVDVLTEHMVGDLWIVYGIDYPHSTSVLNVEKLKAIGVDATDLKQLGLENVARLLDDLEYQSYDAYSVLTSANPVYLSSTLLLDYVWDFLANKVNGDLVVAVPARDTVIFCDSHEPEGIQALREEAEHVIRTGDHVLSEALLYRASGKWTLLE